MRNGRRGYINSTHAIVQSAREIAAGIKSIPYMKIIGDPLSSVVAFSVHDKAPFGTYAVADLLSRRGWHLNILQVFCHFI